MFKKMLCLLIAAALALCAIAAAAESENLPDAGQEQANAKSEPTAVTAAEQNTARISLPFEKYGTENRFTKKK